MASNNYRVPKDARRRLMDVQYLRYKSENLNLPASQRLLREERQCDAVLGGDLVWMHGERKKDGSRFKYPLVVGGKRCENVAIATRATGGHTIRRCECHLEFARTYWPEDEQEQVA